MSERSARISRLLTSLESRTSYIQSKLGVLVPSQIRSLRFKSNMPRQSDLAREAKMYQSRISVFETPGAANMTLETLSRLAAAFKVGLVVEFVPFSEMLDWENGFSQGAFNVTRLEDDLDFMRPAARAVRVRRRARPQKSFNESRLVQMPIQSPVSFPLPVMQERAQVKLHLETPTSQVPALNRVTLSAGAGSVRNLPVPNVAAGAGGRYAL